MFRESSSNTSHYLCLLLVTLHAVSSAWSTCSSDRKQFTDTGNTSRTRLQSHDFQDCTSATLVNVSYGAISHVQNDSFFNMYAMQSLDLSHNNISQIPENLFITSRLLALLNMSNNAIVSVPDFLFSNTLVLTRLDLSYNKISILPSEVFLGLRHLRLVDLRHNDLVEFEPWPYFGLLESIELFDLRWNHISVFSNRQNWTFDPNNLQASVRVDLRHNSFNEWHDQFLLQYFTGEEQSSHVILGQLNIDLRENSWICDCNMYALAHGMKTSMYRFRHQEILKLTCASPSNLRGKELINQVHLDEMLCDIKANCPNGCKCSEYPYYESVKVDCALLNLTEMPTDLPSFQYQKIDLNLSGNAIHSLEVRKYDKYLNELILSNNKLGYVDVNALQSMSNTIKFMDLSNNYISKLPTEVQALPFQSIILSHNMFECNCDMTWMSDWIRLAPIYADKTLTCTEKDSNTVYKITEVNDELLKCLNTFEISVVIVFSIVLALVIAAIVTIKRCPYESKVLLYKFLKLHPSDKYKVDHAEQMEYDLYISCDDDDVHLMQWVRRTLAKRLEDQKPQYKLFIPLRDLPCGIPEADVRVETVEKSKRLVIILSEGYVNNEWCEYEVQQSETLENNEGRIFYITYDSNGKDVISREPWRSRVEGRRVLSPNDRMFWAKLRYELPVRRS